MELRMLHREGNGNPLQYCWLEKSHGRRSLVGYSPWGREELDRIEWLHFHFSHACIGEGNGNPLQCSCLENPRDSGAWWAAIYGVAQSWTQLNWLSSSRELHRASLMAQQVKNLPAMQETRETWLQSLVERLLGGYGNLLQYSCMENPMDRGTRWATVHEVTVR